MSDGQGRAFVPPFPKTRNSSLSWCQSYLMAIFTRPLSLATCRCQYVAHRLLGPGRGRTHGQTTLAVNRSARERRASASNSMTIFVSAM
jgi:hypothetical protein